MMILITSDIEKHNVIFSLTDNIEDAKSYIQVYNIEAQKQLKEYQEKVFRERDKLFEILKNAPVHKDIKKETYKDIFQYYDDLETYEDSKEYQDYKNFLFSHSKEIAEIESHIKSINKQLFELGFYITEPCNPYSHSFAEKYEIFLFDESKVDSYLKILEKPIML